MRSLVKIPLRPLWRRLAARIDNRVEAQHQSLLVDLQPLKVLDRSWRTHTPAFLNAVSTVGAFGHALSETQRETQKADERLKQLEVDLRSIKRQVDDDVEALETLPKRTSGDLDAATWPDDTSRLKLARQGIKEQREDERPRQDLNAGFKNIGTDQIKLNLGCGKQPLESYVNIDSRELPGVNIVADLANLPFELETVSEIRIRHVLEHLPQEDSRQRMLPLWRDLLRPVGKLQVIASDGERMLQNYANGTFACEELCEMLFGQSPDCGKARYSHFTPTSLRRLLNEAGFREDSEPDLLRRNEHHYEFAVVSTRG